MNAASNNVTSTKIPNGWFKTVACALLFVLSVTLFWPVSRHQFINFDDPEYLTANQHIQNGLTADGVRWAFTQVHGEATYWHPVTWLSHMMDCELFGLNPRAHHLVNVLF